MPTYLFLNKETGEEWEAFMSISEGDEFLIKNPHIEKLVNGFPASVTSAMGGKTKPDAGFRDLLKDIKKKNSRGLRRSTINTF